MRAEGFDFREASGADDRRGPKPKLFASRFVKFLPCQARLACLETCLPDRITRGQTISRIYGRIETYGGCRLSDGDVAGAARQWPLDCIRMLITSLDWFSQIAPVGVAVGAVSLVNSRRQARPTFEDELTKQYRQITQRISTVALLGETLTLVATLYGAITPDPVAFDFLTRMPAPELTTEERTEVKKVVKELLTRVKSLLVIDWRQSSSSRSQLKIAIEDVLDSGLPRAFTPELYKQKCSALFEHMYERYPQAGAGVYSN